MTEMLYFLTLNLANGLLAVALIVTAWVVFDWITPGWDFDEIFRADSFTNGGAILAALVFGIAVVVAFAAT